MTRKISEIQEAMVSNAASSVRGLSDSKTSEWRLWTWIVATAIHTFELIMELFGKKM